MIIGIRKNFVLVVSLLLFAASAFPEILPGTTGSAAGADWQASWLDLNPPITFKKGEILKIKVDGNAENVVVSLLPANSSYGSPDGIEGTVRKVPASKIVEVKLERDHPNVKQISVHAGRKAWSTPLGGNNGTIAVVSVD